MTEQEIKIQCIAIANQSRFAMTSAQVIEVAKLYYGYVTVTAQDKKTELSLPGNQLADASNNTSHDHDPQKRLSS